MMGHKNESSNKNGSNESTNFQQTEEQRELNEQASIGLALLAFVVTESTKEASKEGNNTNTNQRASYGSSSGSSPTKGNHPMDDMQAEAAAANNPSTCHAWWKIDTDTDQTKNDTNHDHNVSSDHLARLLHVLLLKHHYPTSISTGHASHGHDGTAGRTDMHIEEEQGKATGKTPTQTQAMAMAMSSEIKRSGNETYNNSETHPPPSSQPSSSQESDSQRQGTTIINNNKTRDPTKRGRRNKKKQQQQSPTTSPTASLLPPPSLPFQGHVQQHSLNHSSDGAVGASASATLSSGLDLDFISPLPTTTEFDVEEDSPAAPDSSHSASSPSASTIMNGMSEHPPLSMSNMSLSNERTRNWNQISLFLLVLSNDDGTSGSSSKKTSDNDNEAEAEASQSQSNTSNGNGNRNQTLLQHTDGGCLVPTITSDGSGRKDGASAPSEPELPLRILAGHLTIRVLEQMAIYNTEDNDDDDMDMEQAQSTEEEEERSQSDSGMIKTGNGLSATSLTTIAQALQLMCQDVCDSFSCDDDDDTKNPAGLRTRLCSCLCPSQEQAATAITVTTTVTTVPPCRMCASLLYSRFGSLLDLIDGVCCLSPENRALVCQSSRQGNTNNVNININDNANIKSSSSSSSSLVTSLMNVVSKTWSMSSSGAGSAIGPGHHEEDENDTTNTTASIRNRNRIRIVSSSRDIMRQCLATLTSLGHENVVAGTEMIQARAIPYYLSLPSPSHHHNRSGVRLVFELLQGLANEYDQDTKQQQQQEESKKALYDCIIYCLNILTNCLDLSEDTDEEDNHKKEDDKTHAQSQVGPRAQQDLLNAMICNNFPTMRTRVKTEDTHATTTTEQPTTTDTENVNVNVNVNVPAVQWLAKWVTKQTAVFRHSFVPNNNSANATDAAAASATDASSSIKQESNIKTEHALQVVKTEPTTSTSIDNTAEEEEDVLSHSEEESLVLAGNGFILLTLLMLDKKKKNEKHPKPKQPASRSVSVSVNDDRVRQMRQVVLQEISAEAKLGTGVTGTAPVPEMTSCPNRQSPQSEEGAGATGQNTNSPTTATSSVSTQRHAYAYAPAFDLVSNTLKAFLNYYHFSVGALSVAVVAPVVKLLAKLEELKQIE